jgi:hypothetical protein
VLGTLETPLQLGLHAPAAGTENWQALSLPVLRTPVPRTGRLLAAVLGPSESVPLENLSPVTLPGAGAAAALPVPGRGTTGPAGPRPGPGPAMVTVISGPGPGAAGPSTEPRSRVTSHGLSAIHGMTRAAAAALADTEPS